MTLSASEEINDAAHNFLLHFLQLSLGKTRIIGNGPNLSNHIGHLHCGHLKSNAPKNKNPPEIQASSSLKYLGSKKNRYMTA